ncbi:GNAT family N-acetyltransferase [Marinivivus vitaminiproducens]|uniref:GNAT family N-acetyltransferase n=1 Tax=Marinivivus vitaminiproducens TaxID=3035935 RepID=UPI003F9F21ED
MSAVEGLIREAFAGKPYSGGNEADIMAGLRRAGAATVALVAEDGEGALVGQIVFSPVTIEGRPSDWHALGPVAVKPERQGQGIGAALIEAGLARLARLGSAGCVLLGDPGYYRRFGFRRMERLRVDDLPAEYLMARPADGVEPSGTLAFHPAFGVGA